MSSSASAVTRQKRNAPIFPGVWMCPGMIPILHPRGSIIPGQLGPRRAQEEKGQLSFLSLPSTRSFIRSSPPPQPFSPLSTPPQLENFIRKADAALTDHPRLALALQGIHDLDLVELGDSLGDGDNESDLSLDSLKNGIGGSGRRNVDDGCVGLGVLDGLQVEGSKGKGEGEGRSAREAQAEAQKGTRMLRARWKYT